MENNETKINEKLRELTDEELRQVVGGTNPIVDKEGFAGIGYDGLNIKEIESFTILKDASLTAIYGFGEAN